MGLKISSLYLLQKIKTPKKDTKLHLIIRIQLGVVVPVRVQSMGQIGLFKNYLYLIGIPDPI